MERRRELRIETNVALDCRMPAMPRKGFMDDVSSQGCRLRIPVGQLELGSTVLVDLPRAPRFPGTIVWLDSIHAGVRFDRRLGRQTSIALGLEDPEPEPDLELVAIEQSTRQGLLRHWMRRISAAFS
jgi:hypothetical protein